MSNPNPTTGTDTPQLAPIPQLSRRIITGVDSHSKKSKVVIDDRGGHIESFPDDIYRFQTVWCTPSLPVDCSGTSNSNSPSNDLDPMMKITKLDDIPDTGVVGNFVWTKPLASVPLHKTPSLDFGILLEGTMELLMENGDVRILNVGDVVVQRETLHGWRNPSSTEWCKMFFVGVGSTNAMSKVEPKAEST